MEGEERKEKHLVLFNMPYNYNGISLWLEVAYILCASAWYKYWKRLAYRKHYFNVKIIVSTDISS